MKQSSDNRIVTAVFICEDNADVDRVIKEVYSLATERGCNLISSGVDLPNNDQKKMAKALGIYDSTDERIVLKDIIIYILFMLAMIVMIIIESCSNHKHGQLTIQPTSQPIRQTTSQLTPDRVRYPWDS